MSMKRGEICETNKRWVVQWVNVMICDEKKACINSGQMWYYIVVGFRKDKNYMEDD